MDASSESPGPSARGPEFRGGRAASNTLVIAAGQLFVVAIALVTTPIVLNKIGLVEFGIWTIAITTVGYLTVIDPGFSNLVTRYGAQARVRGDRHVAARISTVGTLAWLGFGLLLTPLVIIAVPWAVHLVHLSRHQNLNTTEKHSAIIFFYWSFGLVIFGSIQATVSGQLSAIGDQWLVTAIDVGTRVIYAVTLLVLLARGWRLEAIIAATTVQYVLAYLATLVSIVVRGGRPFANPRRLDPAMKKELFRFGGWLQFSSLLDTLTYETDPIVLTLLVGASASGIWGVAQRLSRQITYFAYIPQATILPAISAAHAAGEGLAALRRIYVRAQRVIVLLGAFLAGTIIAFGPVLLKAWLGRSFTQHNSATVATVLVALTMMAGLPRPVTANAILAMGRIGLGVRAQLLAFVVNVILTLALVGPFGLNGVLFGTVVAKVVATTYLLMRFARIVDSSFRELVWPWLAPLLAVTALTAVAGRLVMVLWPAAHEQRLTSLVALAVFGTGYAAIFAVGLRVTRYFSRDDLQWMKSTAPGRAGRLFTPRVVRLLTGTSS